MNVRYRFVQTPPGQLSAGALTLGQMPYVAGWWHIHAMIAPQVDSAFSIVNNNAMPVPSPTSEQREMRTDKVARMGAGGRAPMGS
jgi:hypothetical protein